MRLFQPYLIVGVDVLRSQKDKAVQLMVTFSLVAVALAKCRMRVVKGYKRKRVSNGDRKRHQSAYLTQVLKALKCRSGCLTGDVKRINGRSVRSTGAKVG